MINAVQAMEQTPDPRRLTVRSRRGTDDASVVVTVEDTGPAFPRRAAPAVRALLHDQAVGVGTGVGLASATAWSRRTAAR